MPSSGFVSIILPVYNAAPFVSATIASLLDQTHREFEVIAVDDGSTDESRSILEQLARGDSRIRVFSKENGGSSAATNFGIAFAEGDFIARMDADDLAYRTRISDEVALLMRSDDIALCSTDADYTFFPGKVLSGARRPRSSKEIRVENIFGTFHIHPTVVFDMRKLDRASVHYDEHYLLAEDFELLSRIDLSHPTAIIPESRLLVRRQGHGSVSSRLSARNAGYHFQVTMRQLAAAGIAEGDAALHTILAGAQPVGADELDPLAAWLLPIAEFRGYEGAQAEAYRRGLENFTDSVVSALYGRIMSTQLRILLQRSGLAQYMSRFDHLRLTLGSAGARRIDRASGGLRQMHRYLKSRPRSVLSDQLCGPALDGF